MFKKSFLYMFILLMVMLSVNVMVYAEVTDEASGTGEASGADNEVYIEYVDDGFEGRDFTADAAVFYPAGEAPDDELELFSDDTRVFDASNPGYGSQLEEGTVSRKIYDGIKAEIETISANMSDFTGEKEITIDVSSFNLSRSSNDIGALVADAAYAYVYDR